MRIVIDTNIVISAVFFGGTPRKIIDAILRDNATAFATIEIVEEYEEIKTRMINVKHKTPRQGLFDEFIEKLNIIDSQTEVDVCRDPDDNKFIACAVDADAVYIVSGDNDLLTIKRYGKIEIITASEFCEKYLS